MTATTIIHDSFFQNFLGEMITFTNGLLPQKNVILNVMRVNGYYFSRFSLGSRTINLIICIFISAVVSMPMALVTLGCQWLRRSGTMVVVAKKMDGASN
jgi:hypothetical protein